MAESAAPTQAKIGFKFDRDENPSVVRVAVLSLFGREAAAAAIATLCANGSIDSAWYTIKPGPPQTRVLYLQFNGEVGLASQRIGSLLTFLRNDDGTWKEIFAKGKNGQAVHLILGRDKNGRRMLEPSSVKPLLEICREVFPAGEFSSSRTDKAIYMDWPPLVRVQGVSLGVAKLKWNYTAIATALHRVVDRAKVQRLFHERLESRRAGSASGVDWRDMSEP